MRALEVGEMRAGRRDGGEKESAECGEGLRSISVRRGEEGRGGTSALGPPASASAAAFLAARVSRIFSLQNSSKRSRRSRKVRTAVRGSEIKARERGETDRYSEGR